MRAYKERALQACQKDALGSMLGVSAQTWANPKLDLADDRQAQRQRHLWQIDQRAMERALPQSLPVHQRRPALEPTYCEYDIVNSAATVHR